jgi:putative nucleotidyltransferase with HDIG domain
MGQKNRKVSLTLLKFFGALTPPNTQENRLLSHICPYLALGNRSQQDKKSKSVKLIVTHALNPNINQPCLTLEIEVNGKAYYDKDSIVDSLILFLGKVVSLKSPYTMNHSNHVRNLTLTLARQIGFSPDRCKALEYAAILHDIGKIAISEYVINKPTMLTELEMSMMQQHTILGHKLIQSLCLDQLIGEVILYHHENYDGSGYPEGLKGDQIPLAARLVRVTDTFDAMVPSLPRRL